MRVRQEAVFDGHTDDIHNLVFSPASDLLVSTSNDGSVRIWDLVERRQLEGMSGFETLGDSLPAGFPETIADVCPGRLTAHVSQWPHRKAACISATRPANR